MINSSSFILEGMYLAIDIGGTKTLVAVFDESGVILEKVKFPTPQDYQEFLAELQKALAGLKNKTFTYAAVANPGRVSRARGVVLGYGNLPWTNVPIRDDFKKFINCPILVENDAKLAGLSEAILVKDTYKKVLYVTISTGISNALIVDGQIDPDLEDSEGGHMVFEHEGQTVSWESFASGKAIVKQFGKIAAEITDPEAWKTIAHNIAIGLVDLIAVTQPEVVIIGGGVGTHFDKFGAQLTEELKKYESPLLPIPPVQAAERAEEAVIYGCNELIHQHIGQIPA